jgi:hypothetical protein
VSDKDGEEGGVSKYLSTFAKIPSFLLSLSGFSATTILRRQSDGGREETDRSKIEKNKTMNTKKDNA